MSVNGFYGFEPSTKKKNSNVEVVPWCNARQFRKVYESLCSDDVVDKKWAYDMISIWDTRCYPLPPPIEASYALTGAIIQDILKFNGESHLHHIDLQGIYVSAIIRFVTLTVETHHDYIHKLRTLHDVAKGLGIPTFIVDIRNQWNHSPIRPSLSELRAAAEAAFKYLKEQYWEKEAFRVKNHIKRPLDEEVLYKLLHDYIMVQFQKFKTRKEDSSDSSAVIEDFYLIKRAIKKWIVENKRLFIKVLISDGIFVFHEDYMKHLSDEDSSQDQVEFGDDDEEEYSYDDTDEEEYHSSFKNKFFIRDIPKWHEEMWAPIIRMLNMCDGVPIFMESLLKSVGDRAEHGQHLIISWVLKILRIHFASARIMSSPLSHIFQKCGIVANWESMFFASVMNPCKLSTAVIPLIYSQLEMKKDDITHVMGLMGIYLGEVKDISEAPKTTFTVDQLKQTKELQKDERAKREGKSVEDIWPRCPDDCHKSWPIGTVLNNTDDEENEEKQIDENFRQALSNVIEFEEPFLPSNKNDDEHSVMDVEKPDTPEPNYEEVIKKLHERRSYLYKK